MPPVALTFYSFRVMVIAGSYLLLFFVVMLLLAYRFPAALSRRWLQWVGMLTIPVVWVCSEAGWVTAEVGRQPWIIQDLMPCRAAVSAVSAGSVQLTFWLFALVFTAFLAAEMCIMLKAIERGSKQDYESLKD